MTVTVATKLVPFTLSVLLDNSENMLPDNHRLAEIRWKETTDKDTKQKIAARSAVCVAVPTVEITVNHVELRQAMQAAFEDLQDKAIRTFINSKIEEDTSINLVGLQIPEATLSIAGIADFAAMQATSGKLSASTIGAWFDATMSDPFMVALLEKAPNLDQATLEKAVEQHKKLLQSLSSPRAAMPIKVAEQLQRALNVVPGKDKIRDTLNSKLDVFTKPKDFDLGMSL